MSSFCRTFDYSGDCEQSQQWSPFSTSFVEYLSYSFLGTSFPSSALLSRLVMNLVSSFQLFKNHSPNWRAKYSKFRRNLSLWSVGSWVALLGADSFRHMSDILVCTCCSPATSCFPVNGSCTFDFIDHPNAVSHFLFLRKFVYDSRTVLTFFIETSRN